MDDFKDRCRALRMLLLLLCASALAIGCVGSDNAEAVREEVSVYSGINLAVNMLTAAEQAHLVEFPPTTPDEQARAQADIDRLNRLSSALQTIQTEITAGKTQTVGAELTAALALAKDALAEAVADGLKIPPAVSQALDSFAEIVKSIP